MCSFVAVCGALITAALWKLRQKDLEFKVSLYEACLERNTHIPCMRERERETHRREEGRKGEKKLRWVKSGPHQ